MKRFLQQHGLWILGAAALIAVGLSLASVFSSGSSPLENAAGVIASPFRAAYTSVAGFFTDKADYYADVKALKEENEALQKELADQKADIRQAKADRAENQRLRKLLDLREQRRDFVFEAATVTEHRSTNWTSSLTLNRGSKQGVETGDCVIVETGELVGIVTKTGLNWCTVLTIIDTDTALGARLFRTDEIGVAEGDFELMNDGKLKFDYTAPDTKPLNGDIIVTSGLGDSYPAGLVIGAVDEVMVDDSGTTRYAIVSPQVTFDDLTEVFIIKDFDIVD